MACGTSGGHAPIPFATQPAERPNQVRPAGSLLRRRVTIWVRAPLALVIQHVKPWAEVLAISHPSGQ